MKMRVSVSLRALCAKDPFTLRESGIDRKIRNTSKKIFAFASVLVPCKRTLAI